MIYDEYTDPHQELKSLNRYSMIAEMPRKAYTVTPKRWGGYRDANWMP